MAERAGHAGALCLALLELGSVVGAVGRTLEPHRLCAYLFDLAQTFSQFYEHCPVLKVDDAEVRAAHRSSTAPSFCAALPVASTRATSPSR